MMTLDEMQIAVYKMIPAKVKKKRDWFYGELKWEDKGLQVCHEAEKLLDDNQRLTYWIKLAGFYSDEARFAVFATYEQRLEALCRVWFPERFNET